MKDIGEQYPHDDSFKALARLHQSRYRANILQVEFNEFGNRLTEADAKALLNYYDGLNVRQALRDRYPSFSKTREADMLRSEHIPFNIFAPLCLNKVLAKRVIETAFGIDCESSFSIDFEFAPTPKGNYLDDATAFDTFIRFKDSQGKNIGIGIEVKYTEKEYTLGSTEKLKVEDSQSLYWKTTQRSGAFLDSADSILCGDELRQIWRNHLLGLSMCQRQELNDFYSITLYPSGNQHFQKAISHYQSRLLEPWSKKVFGCTYEKYIEAIEGDDEILKWKQYLSDRYLIKV